MPLIEYDPQDSLHLRAGDGLYERPESVFVSKNLKSGQTFVDVGAHIGYYSVLAAGLVGPMGLVLAFEPGPDNFRALAENTRSFGPPCRIFNLAVSDRPGKSRLWISPGNSGDNRLYKVEGRESVEVEAVSLDHFHALEGKKIDFLKVDVQGLEIAVLRGAAAAIDRSDPFLGIVEYAPKHLKLSGSHASDLLAILSDLGLRAYFRGSKRRLEKATWPALKKLPRHTNLIISRRPLL